MTHAVVRTVLPNGLTVLVRRDATAPVVAIVTWVKAGYFDETDDLVGIAHVLEHMYFKGTPTRGPGEIAKATKACGGFLNAATIYDHTAYYAVVPSGTWVQALDVQFDAYAHSVIDDDELARELEVIIQEAKRKADNPGAVCTETLFEVLHDTHRMRRWRIGREAGLRTFTRDKVAGFYRNFYAPQSTVLSVVGDVDPAVVLAEVTARYGTLTDHEPVRHPGALETSAPSFRWREWGGDIANAEMAIGWRTVDARHPDAPALDVAAAILGAGRASRLYRSVRERSLASLVSASHYTPTELGVFVVHAEAPSASAPDALAASWREVRRLREHEVSADEVARAQRLFEARWLRRLESMDGQAMHLAEWEALGAWQMGDAYLEALRHVTAAEVQRVAQQYLNPDHAAVVVYRPTAMPTVAGDAVKGRAMLDAADAPAPAVASIAPALVKGSGHATFEQEMGGTRVYRTRHGVPILVRRKVGAPIAHIGAWLVGGACDEPNAQAGLTLLTARTMPKGSTTRNAADLALAAETLGGSLSSSTGAETVGWGISVPTAALEAATALLSDVVLRPAFDAGIIENERAVALAELSQLQDDTYRYPMRLLVEAAWKGHPYGTSASGSAETLRAITRDEIMAWHHDHFVQAAGAIGLVGDVEPDVAADLLARAFDHWRHAAPILPSFPQWTTAPILNVVERAKNQTGMALAFEGPTRRDPSHHAGTLLAVIASGLGGRFFEALRDAKSLAYTVSMFPSERRTAGLVGAYIATSPEREDEARAGLLAEFAKLRHEPVRADELTRAKAYALGTHAIRQQSGSAVLGELLDAWLLGDGLHELDEWPSAIASLAPYDLHRYAERWFDPERRVEGMVRGAVGRTV